MGKQEEIEAFAKENGIVTEGFEYYDYTEEENRLALAEEYTAKYDEFSAKAVARKSKDPLRAALFLLKLHHVDCVAAGKEYSTGDVIFESIAIVGMQEGVESVSSLGIADIRGFDGPQGTMLGLADCAITAQPDAKDLAGIAISSADTASKLLGWDPALQCLHFLHAEVRNMRVWKSSVKQLIVRESRPDIKIDGEFELDSVIIPQVAERKVNGKVNVAGKQIF